MPGAGEEDESDFKGSKVSAGFLDFFFFQSHRKALKVFDKEMLWSSLGTLARKQKSIVGEEND